MMLNAQSGSGVTGSGRAPAGASHDLSEAPAEDSSSAMRLAVIFAAAGSSVFADRGVEKEQPRACVGRHAGELLGGARRRERSDHDAGAQGAQIDGGVFDRRARADCDRFPRCDAVPLQCSRDPVHERVKLAVRQHALFLYQGGMARLPAAWPRTRSDSVPKPISSAGVRGAFMGRDSTGGP